MDFFASLSAIGVLMGAMAILATLVRGATLEPDPGHRIRPLVRVSMRPQGGMPMTLRLRGG